MENQTLTIVLIIVAGASNVALFINLANNRHIPGLHKITFGFLFTTVGSLLLTFQEALPLLASVLLANALVLGGRIPILLGLAEFWNQEKSRLPAICAALFVLSLGGIYYYTMIDPVGEWRIRIYTVMMVVVYLCSMFLIANGLRIERRLRPVMSVSSNFGAFLALMLFGFNTVTEFILMVARTGEMVASVDDGTSLLVLGQIFTLAVFAFAIIIMTMEELSVEHKENAIYDPVTTILNHRTFLEVGQRILGVALRYSQPVSLLTIEVDNMDEVVKEHGYKVGNEVLRHFSLLATDRRRNEDVLARSSFKEFRMLLPGVDEAGARVVIEKIRKKLEGAEYIYRGKPLAIRVNIASVTCREEDLNLQQMLQEGEVELYRIKHAGPVTPEASAPIG